MKQDLTVSELLVHFVSRFRRLWFSRNNIAEAISDQTEAEKKYGDSKVRQFSVSIQRNEIFITLEEE